MTGLRLFCGLFVMHHRMSLLLWVKRYILKTKKGRRMKAIVQIGYTSYVMDAEKAIAVLEMLSGAEVYEGKWNSLSKSSTYYIYPQDNDTFIKEMKLLPDALYRMAKLAGKPNKE